MYATSSTKTQRGNKLSQNTSLLHLAIFGTNKKATNIQKIAICPLNISLPHLKQLPKQKLQFGALFIVIQQCVRPYELLFNKCGKVPTYVSFLKRWRDQRPEIVKAKGKMPATNIHHVLGLIEVLNFSLLTNSVSQMYHYERFIHDRNAFSISP